MFKRLLIRRKPSLASFTNRTRLGNSSLLERRKTMKKIFFKIGNYMFCLIRRYNKPIRYSLYQKTAKSAKYIGSADSGKLLVLLACFISGLIS